MRDAATLARSLTSPRPASAMRSALLLRGGLQSLLWGGELSRAEFVHSVLLGLVANSIAMHLCTLSTDWLCSCVRPATSDDGGSRGQLLRRLSSSALWHLATLVAGFVAYLVVFRLTGFVPMGYVMGNKPAIPLFEPPVAT